MRLLPCFRSDVGSRFKFATCTWAPIGSECVADRARFAVDHSAVLPPPIEMTTDGLPHDESPVTLDDAVPGRTGVKLRFLRY